MSRILFRPVRGGLDQALAECREFTSRIELLNFLCAQEQNYFGREFKPTDFTFRFYCIDDRIDWETFIICNKANNGYPVGYCAFNEGAKKVWRKK